MKEVFQTNNCSYDFKNPRILASKHKSTRKYGINTIALKGPQIWQNIPLEYKADVELTLSIKKNCRSFIVNLGYIDLFFYTMIPFTKCEIDRF